MIRGRALESAIQRALKHYERAGRVGDAEKKQLKRLWNGRVIGGAPLDFKMIAWGYGEHGENIGVAIEAKEIGGHDLEFGEGGLRQTQFDALNEYLKRPGDRRAFVVVDVKSEGECYRLDWAVVQREFVNVAWRKSLDLKFIRGFGEQLKVSGDGDKRRVWVLDAFDHAGKVTAAMGVIAERAAKKRVELFADAPASAPTPVIRRTAEECKAAVRNAIAAYRPKVKQGWRGGK